jgi:hypothetical protein
MHGDDHDENGRTALIGQRQSIIYTKLAEWQKVPGNTLTHGPGLFDA